MKYLILAELISGKDWKVTDNILDAIKIKNHYEDCNEVIFCDMYAVNDDQATEKSNTNKFTFFWLDGKVQIGEGNTVAEAFTNLGYGQGALAALDFHGEGDLRDKYVWVKDLHRWALK